MDIEVEVNPPELMRKLKSDLWKLYENRTRYSPLPIVATEGHHHIIRYANPAFCCLAGKTSEEMMGIPFGQALPEGEGERVLTLLDRVLATHVTESISDRTHLHQSKTGQYWGYAVWAILEEDCCPPGVMIQVTEMSKGARTLQRATEVGEALVLFGIKQRDFVEAAEMSNQRLELAIRETEHRAKNSLHIISSSLSMQLRANAETVPSLELVKLQMHIHTIAAMHDLLASSKKAGPNAENTSVHEMLQKLLPMWQTVMGTERFMWNCEDIHMSIKRCTSLVTIINELVCNSVKHGAQTVTVLVTRNNSMVTLEVSDSGGGFPKDFNIKNARGFGLRFVESVSQSEFEGKTSYENSSQGGACIKMTFSQPELLVSPEVGLKMGCITAPKTAF